VCENAGAVYSSEILDRFFLSESTLRRRRPQLAWLGISLPRARPRVRLRDRRAYPAVAL